MITYVKSKILLTSDYEDDEIKLEQTPAELTFRLMGGRDSASISAVAGINKKTGSPITARLTFPYVTDTLNNCVEVTSNEYISDNSPKLMLLSDEKVICEMSAFTDKETFLRQCGERGRNLHEKINTSLFNAVQPSLHSVFNEFLSTAEENEVSIRIKVNLAEEYKDAYVAYKNGRLSHIFDPDRDNPDDYHLEPLRSQFNGNVTPMGVGTQHNNVEKSSGDKNPETGPNWIQFWILHTKQITGFTDKPICCYFEKGKENKLANCHICTAYTINDSNCWGCHTVGPTVVTDVQWGVPTATDPTVVYIMAACSASNSHWNKNTFSVMTATYAVELMNYHQ
jgi:hypothetical protein